MTDKFNPLQEGMNADFLSTLSTALNQISDTLPNVPQDLAKTLSKLRVNSKIKPDPADVERAALPAIFKVGKLTYTNLVMYTSVLGIQLTDVFKPAITGSEEIQGSYVANFWKYEKTARETAVRDKDKLPLVCTDTSTVGTVTYQLEDEDKPPADWIGGPLSTDTTNWKPFLVMTATPQRVSIKEERNQCVYDENKEINWHETLVNFLEASFA